MSIKKRDELEWFVCEMELTLRENDHKGGWKKYVTGNTKGFFIDKLLEETRELISCLTEYADHNPDDITKEASDVANIAMMIADNWGEDTTNRFRGE